MKAKQEEMYGINMLDGDDWDAGHNLECWPIFLGMDIQDIILNTEGKTASKDNFESEGKMYFNELWQLLQKAQNKAKRKQEYIRFVKAKAAGSKAKRTIGEEVDFGRQRVDALQAADHDDDFSNDEKVNDSISKLSGVDVDTPKDFSRSTDWLIQLISASKTVSALEKEAFEFYHDDLQKGLNHPLFTRQGLAIIAKRAFIKWCMERRSRY